MVGWDHLVETFKKLTGKKGDYNRESIEEWFSKIENADKPLQHRWWNSFRDDLHKRNMEWIRKIKLNGNTLEKWMVGNKYDGVLGKTGVLNIVQDGVSKANRKE